MFEKIISEESMNFDDFLRTLENNKDVVGKAKIEKSGLLLRKKILDVEDPLVSILPLIKEELSPSKDYEPFVKYRIAEKRDGTKIHEFIVEYLTRDGTGLYDKKSGEYVELRELEKICIIKYREN